MNVEPDELKRKRFFWGVLLAWSPFVVVTGFSFLNMFRGISHQKAAGLGAVAGGIAEAFLGFGMIVTVVFEVSAIVLLLRAFSKGRRMRAFASVLSICCGCLTLLILGTFFWLVFFHVPR